MADLRTKLTPVVAKGFDIERKLLFPGSYIVLLRRDGRSEKFGELRRYLKGFKPVYDSFRNQLRLEIATLDDLQADSLELSHFWFMGRVYSVSQADITPPFGDRFTWLILGTASAKDTYTPEVI